MHPPPIRPHIMMHPPALTGSTLHREVTDTLTRVTVRHCRRARGRGWGLWRGRTRIEGGLQGKMIGVRGPGVTIVQSRYSTTHRDVGCHSDSDVCVQLELCMRVRWYILTMVEGTTCLSIGETGNRNAPIIPRRPRSTVTAHSHGD